MTLASTCAELSTEFSETGILGGLWSASDPREHCELGESLNSEMAPQRPPMVSIHALAARIRPTEVFAVLVVSAVARSARCSTDQHC